MRDAVFHTAFGWAGVAVSEKGICRVVLPMKEKKAVEKELASSEFGVRRSVEKENPPQSPFLKGGGFGFPPLAKGGAGGFEGTLMKAAKLLQNYFSGGRVLFDLPLNISYYTAFQQAVWKATKEIPFGETRSYAWIAKRINRPRAVRAVGSALGANPAPILIP